ncbi:hypothetical protein, partial [Riemerella anatipestifer]
MSKEIIQNDIEAIRNETEMYGNTRERVASILTKLNQEKLDAESIPTNIATIDENGKVGTVYTKTQADKLVKNIANSTLDTTEKGGVNQMYDYRWNVSQDVGFSMYTGENLGLGVEDTSFRLSNGYFNVTQGTGNGRTELTVQKKGIEL